MIVRKLRLKRGWSQSQLAEVAGVTTRMVDAQIVDYRPAVEIERIYPLGSIRKISGQLRFDLIHSDLPHLAGVDVYIELNFAADDPVFDSHGTFVQGKA